ncbi:accessory Sec system protein Asp3 [Lactococcus muris]|uniref:Accessory Sec system protein Asp3 n=1 Tax=Lactococcus muris TaxID=2941330 RepID=A0ABV4D9I0_9LACT
MADTALIKWGKRFNQAYNYGSEITLESHRVTFSSPMMPVGTTIKAWHSKGSYGEDRAAPLLPLLKPGKTYEVIFFIQENPKNQFRVNIDFRDQFGQITATQYFEELHFTFQYPHNAAHYSINLNNIKHEKLVFYDIILMEKVENDSVEVERGEGLTFIKCQTPSEKFQLRVHSSDRESIMVSDNTANLLLFVSQKTDFQAVLSAIIDKLETQDGLIEIKTGVDFAKFSIEFQSLPEILHTYFLDKKIQTDIKNTTDLLTAYEIQMLLLALQK